MKALRPFAAVSAAALAVLCASGIAVASSSNPKYSGWAIANHHGFASSTQPRTGSIARVRIRFDSGVTVRLAASGKRRTYASYDLVYGPAGAQKELNGSFQIPKGAAGRHLALITVPDATAQATGADRTLRATLTTGTRPTLAVTGFPATATRIGISTGGTGKAATTMTAPCRHHEQAVRGSMLITLADGGHRPGSVDNSLTCGLPGVKQES